MVISQRNIAKQEFRQEYQRIESRVENELSRRISQGVTQAQALNDLVVDIVHGRWDVSASSVPGTSNEQQSSNRTPSVVTLRRTLDTLRNLQSQMRAAAGNRPSTSSSIDERPVRPTNLGQAVRNLDPAFSQLPSPHNRESPRSWRTDSLNTLRMVTESVRERTSTDLPRRLNAEVPLRDPDIPSYQYNPASFRFTELTLKQAIKVMVTFDFDRYYEHIKSTLCLFSLRIYGLDDCPLNDLRLAVFLFIEQHFAFQPVIELCVRHIADPSDPNVVGVLFERNEMPRRILNNRGVLDSTQYKVTQNHHADWIIWNYDG